MQLELKYNRTNNIQRTAEFEVVQVDLKAD